MADGNEIALEFPLRALLTILGAIGERLPLLQIPSEQVETARRVLGSDILVMYPSGEIGDYILEAARERDINLLRWDPRAAKGEEIVASLGLKDMEIIIKPRGHEIEVFFGELVAQLEPKQGVYFIAEDNEIDPLWYVSSLDNHGFQQRDDLVVFAMNQVLFKDLLTYANHHDCGIPHPKFEILDTSDESKAAKELVQFMKRHGGGLVYPEITTFCHGVTEIPGQDVTRLDETKARRAIETALNLGSVQTSRGKVVLEAWIPDIVAELFLILCYDGQRFLRCPPIIYQKEFFAGSKARYMYTTVESRTGPGLRNWMPETLPACYNTSERLIKFIYEHMDSLQHVVKSRFTDPCPPLRRTYGFFALKWFITRGRRSYLKELNVAPRDMGFVAEPIREEPVWTMSPTELYLDCIFDRRLPEEVTPYRDALMRFICGQTEAEKITIDSRIDDSQYTQTDIRLYREKTSVYPGRHMGCIRVAEGDNVWNKMVAEELMSQVEIREI